MVGLEWYPCCRLQPATRILFADLTFIGPCIVIYFYSKTNQRHQCLKFILIWNNNLHVSDGLSVHHQEFTTVHTATDICQTPPVL